MTGIQRESDLREGQLLEQLATLTKNTIQPAGDLPPFDRLTVPSDLQRKAFEMLEIPIPT